MENPILNDYTGHSTFFSIKSSFKNNALGFNFGIRFDFDYFAQNSQKL